MVPQFAPMVMPQPQQGAQNPPQTPPGPQGAPMSQPSPNEGNRQMAMVQVETGMQMLERSLPGLGTNTPEHAAVLKALTALSKSFTRSKSQDLVPAQIAEMHRAQQQSPMAQMMAGGGGAPGGAPAPAAPMAA